MLVVSQKLKHPQYSDARSIAKIRPQNKGSKSLCFSPPPTVLSGESWGARREQEALSKAKQKRNAPFVALMVHIRHKKNRKHKLPIFEMVSVLGFEPRAT